MIKVLGNKVDALGRQYIFVVNFSNFLIHFEAEAFKCVYDIRFTNAAVPVNIYFHNVLRSVEIYYITFTICKADWFAQRG